VAADAERRMREFCAQRQQRFAAGLAAIPQLRPLPPEAGMFMLIDVSATGLSGAQFARALYARRGTEHWQTFSDLLVDANKTWAKNAAVLV